VNRRAALFLAVAICAWAPNARADAVDDAFRLGNEAASSGDWQQAIEHYEEATMLLPAANSALSYNLGTAYAHAGQLGRATYHLVTALDLAGGPTAEIAEAARLNLGVVRRRAELQATASGAQIDRPQTWWDVTVDALRAPLVGWIALVCGWMLVGLVALLRFRRAPGQRGRPSASSGGVMGAVLLVLGIVYLGPGLLHGLVVRADRTTPPAVVLVDQLDAREGPGSHRGTAFSVQGGARVRIVDRAPGWAHVRLPGGLEGWVPRDAVAELGGHAAPPVVSAIVPPGAGRNDSRR
jgi:hypothetical protein